MTKALNKTALPPWLPNAISALRILLIPAFLWPLHACQQLSESAEQGASLRLTAWVILVLIGISDLVDGYLARRYQLTTALGATLDALADKLVQIAGITYLTFWHGPAFAAIPLWFFGLLVARDFYMAWGWICLRLRHGKVRVVHHWHGKLASVMIFFLLCGIIAGMSAELTLIGLICITALIVLSTASYSKDGWAQWREIVT